MIDSLLPGKRVSNQNPGQAAASNQRPYLTAPTFEIVHRDVIPAATSSVASRRPAHAPTVEFRQRVGFNCRI
jgi:hypothetical protein